MYVHSSKSFKQDKIYHFSFLYAISNKLFFKYNSYVHVKSSEKLQ